MSAFTPAPVTFSNRARFACMQGNTPFPPGDFRILFNRGIAYAAVFPLPVFAFTRRSLPSKANGMACFCKGGWSRRRSISAITALLELVSGKRSPAWRWPSRLGDQALRRRKTGTLGALRQSQQAKYRDISSGRMIRHRASSAGPSRRCGRKLPSNEQRLLVEGTVTILARPLSLLGPPLRRYGSLSKACACWFEGRP